MAKLSLDKDDLNLEITNTDGTTIILNLVPATLGNQKQIEKIQSDEFEKLQNKEISTDEYYLNVTKTVVSNWSEVEDHFKSYSLNQLYQVSNMITELRGIREKTKEEKKTQ